MIKNFSAYLIESEKEVYFTFGRMNPPTIGHGKVMDTLAKKSGKFDYKVYMSQTQNAKKDPLSYNDKVKHVRKMFPKHARQVIMDKDVKNVFDIAVKLYDAGYTKVNMVVGADRIREFEVLLGKYNGKEARHGFYNFQSINIISAGARDPDATGVEGMSASKQRANATANDFVAFSQGVPTTMSDKDTRKLFNDVRKGMGLKEERQFKNHIELPTVSETREQYVNGDLYSVGDLVIVKETNICAEVAVLGANYVIIEMADGAKSRKWLDDIEPIVEKTLTPAEKKKREEIAKAIEKDSPNMPMDKKMAIATATAKRVAETKQDPDIKDKEGTQPARYHKGLAKSTKAKRDAHFKKNAKKADDDNSAYTPAPGDKQAKTKPSKYTKAFKDMYDEDCWDGYKQVGMKKGRNGNQVPNCVKEEILDEDMLGLGRAFAKLSAKTFKKSDYQKVAKYVIQQSKKDTKHGLEYHASNAIRKFNLKGIDTKALLQTAQSMQEDINPVKQARIDIDREIESDKKRHDRILDRARLARARQRNKETK